MTHHKSTLSVTFANWLPFAVIILVFAGLVYVGVQQNYRLNSDDPQIQNAEDIANALDAGSAMPDSIVPPTPTADIAASLSPMAAVFTSTGTPIGASVLVNNKLPTLPAGVFAYVSQHGEERFTWQPTPTVRIAAVVVHFTGATPGYILVGRSLKEVEKRIQQLTEMTALATLVALILTFLCVWYLTKMHEAHHPRHGGDGDALVL